MSDLFERIRRDKILSSDLRDEIRNMYGKRGERAIRALDEKRVKQYLDFTVVAGHSDEYIVDDDICTCGDFLYRGKECWHILAVRLAVATGSCIHESSWYQDRWKTGHQRMGE